MNLLLFATRWHSAFPAVQFASNESALESVEIVAATTAKLYVACGTQTHTLADWHHKCRKVDAKRVGNGNEEACLEAWVFHAQLVWA